MKPEPVVLAFVAVAIVICTVATLYFAKHPREHQKRGAKVWVWDRNSILSPNVASLQYYIRKLPYCWGQQRQEHQGSSIRRILFLFLFPAVHSSPSQTALVRA